MNLECFFQVTFFITTNVAGMLANSARLLYAEVSCLINRRDLTPEEREMATPVALYDLQLIFYNVNKESRLSRPVFDWKTTSGLLGRAPTLLKLWLLSRSWSMIAIPS